MKWKEVTNTNQGRTVYLPYSTLHITSVKVHRRTIIHVRPSCEASTQEMCDRLRDLRGTEPRHIDQGIFRRNL